LTTDFPYTDQSIRVGADEAAEATLTITNTANLLEAARQKDGKILNALEFPMVLASLDPQPFSTDLLALRFANYNRGVTIPIGDIRWGTAGTTGARTWFHLDCNGLGTSNKVQCGEKIWIFITDDDGNLYNINTFKDFELDEAKGYRLEVVLLTPGTCL
jgi:hypothetical protein